MASRDRRVQVWLLLIPRRSSSVAWLLTGYLALRWYLLYQYSMSSSKNSAAQHKSVQPAGSEKQVLSTSVTTKNSNKTGIPKCNATQTGLLKTRPPLKPTDLDLWRKSKAANSEESSFELKAPGTCCKPDCEADYWCKAWKMQKDSAGAWEKSATELQQRLEQCQFDIKSEREKADQERRRVGRLLKKMQKLNNRVKDLEGEKNKLVTERDQSRLECKDLEQAQKAQSTIVGRLQTQVAEYKRLVATHTVDADCVSDNQIQSEFQNVFNRIRNVAVKLCRGNRFEYRKLSNETKTHIEPFIAKSSNLAKAYHIDFVMCIISQCILELASPLNCFGWSNEEPVASATCLARKIVAEEIPAARKWIQDTRRLLEAADISRLKAAQSTLVDEIVKGLRKTMAPAAPWNAVIEKDIRSVFISVFQLFQTIRSQRDAYAVRMLQISDGGQRFLFDSATMEETTPSSCDVEGYAIEVSVFPGLYKSDGRANEHVVSLPKVKVHLQQTFAERLKSALPERSAGPDAVPVSDEDDV